MFFPSILSTANFIQPRVFQNVAAIISLAPIAIGVGALVNPSAVLASLDLPSPAAPDARRTTLALVRLFGARDLAAGLIVLAIYASGDLRLLGVSMLLGSLMPLVDGVVVRGFTEGGERLHWTAAGAMVAVGAALVGWGL